MEIIYLPQVKSFMETVRLENKKSYAKTLRMISLLKEHGHQLKPPESKQIEPNLFELRVKAEVNIRIFYTFHKSIAFLFHGYIKKTNRIESYVLKNIIRTKNQLTSI